MPLNPVERPVAIVTGAFRGIGRACALGLAGAGFNLLLNDLDSAENALAEEPLQAELATTGAESHLVMGDVGSLEFHANIVDAAVARWGRIDCLVNNAGVPAQSTGDILDVQSDSFDECIRVNTRAVFFLSQAVARYMVAGGRQTSAHRCIINITSSNAKAASFDRSEYCVSKSATSMTTKLFALRLASSGIGVYEIRPGLIETGMTRPRKAHYDKLISEHLVPAERWGQPADVASTVVCMAEGRLAYTVGQAVAVDGGMVMPRY